MTLGFVDGALTVGRMTDRPTRSFFDGPTIRVALRLLADADRNGAANLVDQEVAASCTVGLKDYRQILRRLEAAGMLTRQLHGPGRRKELEPRLIQLHLNAAGWRGVWAWVDLSAAERHVQVELGVPAGRPGSTASVSV